MTVVKTPTVLLVEDSSEDRETYRRYLARDSYFHWKFLEAEGGEQGLALAISAKPDLIVLDYNLPDLNGLEFIQELRRLSFPIVPTLLMPPIIMVTGEGSESVAVASMKAGAKDYLVKGSMTPESLARIGRYVLEEHNLQRSLQIAEERFRTSIANILDCFGIYVSLRDEAGKIYGFQTEYINQSACERDQVVLSVGSSSLTDSSPADPPQWTQELFRDYCQLVETGIPLSREVLVRDASGVAPFGIQQAFDIRATKLGDGFVATWREITDRKRTELENQQLLAAAQAAREEAEAANRAKDEFVAMVSHDLRNPLNSILGWVQILQRSKDETKVKRAIEIIRQSALKQVALVDDLLDMSRILRGTLEIYLQPIDFLTVLKDTLMLMLPMIQQGTLQFYLRLPQLTLEIKQASDLEALDQLGKTLMIEGDTNRLSQVLGNLLTNALKFTPENGQIQVELKIFEFSLQLSIRDSGRGIAPELLPVIFDRFHQGEGLTKSQGLGLGLAIAQSLIQLHHGRIWAESDGPNQGATFTIELPLVASFRLAT